MKNLLTCLALLTAILHFQSCGPNCDAECPEIKEAPQDFLDYWFFPEGSWWVYQLVDEDTAVFDTVFVASKDQWYHEEILECSEDGYAPCVTRYRIYFEHSNQTYFPGHERMGGETYRCEYNSNDDTWYLFHASHTNTLHSFSTFLKSPLQLQEVYYNSTYLCSVNDRFNFNGSQYPSLSVCNENPGPPVNGPSLRKLSYAKGLGLYYIEYNTGDTWELIEYHINQ